MTSPATPVDSVLRRHLLAAASVPSGICTACQELLQVDGAAVLLMADGAGRWQVAAAVGRLAAELEEAQLTVGEGPAVEAYRSGGPVLVSDVRLAAGRWPGFVAVAPAGVRALSSFPLQVGAVQFGALDVYRCTPGRWGGALLGRSLQLADRAAQALIGSLAAAPGNAQDWLETLPGHSADIDQAAGMCSVQLGVTLSVAYARLTGYAFGCETPLAHIARQVVDGRLRLDDDGQHGAGGE